MTGLDSSVEAALVSLMHEKKFTDILRLLKKPSNKKVVERNAMNLISTCCSMVKCCSEILNDPMHLTDCSDILMYLIEKGNPKEVLIGLMESADTFKDDRYFAFVLMPLQKVFTKLPGKRGKSLEWMLDILSAHISTLDLPENRNLEGEELLLMDLDCVVLRTSNVLYDYLDFLDPFIEEVSIPSLQNKTLFYTDRITSQQRTLQKCLLKLLDHPLLYHDLQFQPNRSESSIQSICLKIIEYLKKLCKNFFCLHQPLCIQNSKSKKDDNCCDDNTETDDIPNLSMTSLAYLMFVENLASDSRPYVYRYSFLFEINLACINHVLSKHEYLAVYKGLKLCEEFVLHISEFELPLQCCNMDDFSTLSKSLLNIAVYSSVKRYRSLSIKLFTECIKKFKWKERYSLVMFLVTSLDHSGVHGLLINIYKDFLILESTSFGLTKYFTGNNLQHFLRLSLNLKEDAETDILENYDRIVSGLNFIRFLALFDDKMKNSTGVWSSVDDLKDRYLEPLHRGIELSRAHYKLEAKNSESKKKSKNVLNTTVTVNGELLPNLPPNYKAAIIEKALTSLDMIESILSRVKDLLKKKLH